MAPTRLDRSVCRPFTPQPLLGRPWRPAPDWAIIWSPSSRAADVLAFVNLFRYLRPQSLWIFPFDVDKIGRAVVLWYVLAHNLMRAIALRGEQKKDKEGNG